MYAAIEKQAVVAGDPSCVGHYGIIADEDVVLTKFQADEPAQQDGDTTRGQDLSTGLRKSGDQISHDGESAVFSLSPSS